MNKQQIARTALVAAASLMLAACASRQGAQQQAQQEDQQRSSEKYTGDTAIDARVQSAVLGVPGVHAGDVQISTYDGAVKLQGTVDNQKAARDAIQAARQVQGVKKVDYDLKIK